MFKLQNLLILCMLTYVGIPLVQPQGTPENGYLWQRVNSQLSSPSQPYSLREALAQAQSSRIGASAQALRESLHPILRQKLVKLLWIFSSIDAIFHFYFS